VLLAEAQEGRGARLHAVTDWLTALRAREALEAWVEAEARRGYRRHVEAVLQTAAVPSHLRGAAAAALDIRRAPLPRAPGGSGAGR